jgi:hypothetical protein
MRGMALENELRMTEVMVCKNVNIYNTLLTGDRS